MLREDLAKAEIPYRDPDGRVFDFHSFRHQFISSLSEADVHPRTAQQLARHSTIELTMKRYTHLALRNIMGAVKSIPEPRSPLQPQRQRATGTEDARAGDARVTRTGVIREVKVSSDDMNLARRDERAEPMKVLTFQVLNEAEGKGFEPSTPFGAPHFQCGR